MKQLIRDKESLRIPLSQVVSSTLAKEEETYNLRKNNDYQSFSVIQSFVVEWQLQGVDFKEITDIELFEQKLSNYAH